MTGRRITIAEVRAAYAATKLEPVHGCYFDDGGVVGAREAPCGCPATAVAAVRSGDPARFLASLDGASREDEPAVLNALGVDGAYFEGFVAAVDGQDRDEDLHGETGRAFGDGYEDGAAVRAKLFPERAP